MNQKLKYEIPILTYISEIMMKLLLIIISMILHILLADFNRDIVEYNTENKIYYFGYIFHLYIRHQNCRELPKILA